TIADDLKHQSNDATLGHAQAASPLSDQNQTAIVLFETNTFVAQRRIGRIDLASSGANGGSRYLHDVVLPGFFIGINDPFQPGFTSHVFDIFAAWEPGRSTASAVSGATDRTASSQQDRTTRAAIGRGEVVFNTKPINIAGVAGLNGALDA